MDELAGYRRNWGCRCAIHFFGEATSEDHELEPITTTTNTSGHLEEPASLWLQPALPMFVVKTNSRHRQTDRSPCDRAVRMHSFADRPWSTSSIINLFRDLHDRVLLPRDAINLLFHAAIHRIGKCVPRCLPVNALDRG